MTPEGKRLHDFLSAAIEKTRMPVQELGRPIELAALKARLERAQRQEKAIATIGERYDTVQNAIDEKTAQAIGHVGYLEKYDADLTKVIEGMIGGSNNPPQGANGAVGPNTTGTGTEAEKKTP